MSIIYVVRAGDWLAKIAEEHGTTVLAIWRLPENAEHRTKRRSPDVLYPGDVLYLPVVEAVAQVPAAPVGASPGAEAPRPSAPAWSYPMAPLPRRPQPSWTCPEGICACHPIDERADRVDHTIVLFDARGLRMAFAAYRVFENGRLISGEGAQASALGEAKVRVLPTTSVLRVEWAPAEQPTRDGLPYVKLYTLAFGGDLVADTDRRLANLGFSRRALSAENVRDYQRAIGGGVTGELADIVERVRADHDLAELAGFSEVNVTDAPASAPASWTAFAAQPQKWAGAFGIDAWPTGTTTAPTAARSFTDDDGGATEGPSAQGAVVPEVGDVLVYVAAKDWAFPIGVKGTTIELVPRVGGQNRGPSLPPAEAGGWALIYCFRDVPLGDYGIAVYIENAAMQDKRQVPAMGSTRIEVGLGALTLGYVPLELDRPIMTVDDPLLDLNHEMMQRRRKVLATVYHLLPASTDHTAVAQGLVPPYGQGKYKLTELSNVVSGQGAHGCASVNNAVMLAARGVAGSFGTGILDGPGSVKWAPGRVPSVGDSAYYTSLDEHGREAFEHSGIVVESSLTPGGTWICADGGQPDRTANFDSRAFGKKGKRWWRAFNPPRSAEATYFVPRYFGLDENGRAGVVNGFVFPAPKPGKRIHYWVAAWKNVSDPELRFPQTNWTKSGSQGDYFACKRLISALRLAIAADQAACQAIVDATPPVKAP